jgi:uncharacterized protein (DUF58 family)
LVEGYVAGLHNSPLRGYSVEFAEHREYKPGDDPRYVDWKLFARTGKHYVKQFEDETNLVAYLALDVSESMAYQGPDAALTKWEYSATLAASLSWLVLQQQDAVALATFDAEPRDVLRPSSEATQTAALVQLLERTTCRERSRLFPALRDLASRWKKRGVVLVISDCLDDAAAIVSGLTALTAARHDVTLWHVIDRAEAEFPFTGPLRLQGLEGLGTREVDGRLIRRAYQREFEQHVQQLASRCRAAGIEYVPTYTDEPCDRPLTRFLTRRMSSVQ